MDLKLRIGWDTIQMLQIQHSFQDDIQFPSIIPYYLEIELV